MKIATLTANEPRTCPNPTLWTNSSRGIWRRFRTNSCSMSAITAMPPPKPMLPIFRNTTSKRPRETVAPRSSFSADGSRSAGSMSFPVAQEVFPATTVRFGFQCGTGNTPLFMQGAAHFGGDGFDFEQGRCANLHVGSQHPLAGTNLPGVDVMQPHIGELPRYVSGQAFHIHAHGSRRPQPRVLIRAHGCAPSRGCCDRGPRLPPRARGASLAGDLA